MILFYVHLVILEILEALSLRCIQYISLLLFPLLAFHCGPRHHHVLWGSVKIIHRESVQIKESRDQKVLQVFESKQWKDQ